MPPLAHDRLIEALSESSLVKACANRRPGRSDPGHNVARPRVFEVEHPGADQEAHGERVPGGARGRHLDGRVRRAHRV